jgi:hypothetical protein
MISSIRATFSAELSHSRTPLSLSGYRQDVRLAAGEHDPGELTHILKSTCSVPKATNLRTAQAGFETLRMLNFSPTMTVGILRCSGPRCSSRSVFTLPKTMFEISPNVSITSGFTSEVFFHA